MNEDEAADLVRTLLKGLTAEQAVELIVRALSDGTPEGDERVLAELERHLEEAAAESAAPTRP
jgi:hypothetical protein